MNNKPPYSVGRELTAYVLAGVYLVGPYFLVPYFVGLYSAQGDTCLVLFYIIIQIRHKVVTFEKKEVCRTSPRGKEYTSHVCCSIF